MDVRMVLNELGMTAVYELFQTIIKRKNISIPSYVIMPDHVHFVVNITNPDRVETRRGASHQCDNASHQCNNETSHGTSLQIIPDSL